MGIIHFVFRARDGHDGHTPSFLRYCIPNYDHIGARPRNGGDLGLGGYSSSGSILLSHRRSREILVIHYIVLVHCIYLVHEKAQRGIPLPAHHL